MKDEILFERSKIRKFGGKAKWPAGAEATRPLYFRAERVARRRMAATNAAIAASSHSIRQN